MAARALAALVHRSRCGLPGEAAHSWAGRVSAVRTDARAAAPGTADWGRCLSTSTPPATRPPPGVAFAFDIDGVLLRGTTPIPGAADALRRLLDPRTGAPAAPFVFITNGGGVSEADKAADLRNLLGLPPAAGTPDQVILAHTPFQGLATTQPVLVIGGKRSLAVARAYGFSAAASPAQVAAAAGPAALPLRPPHTGLPPLPVCPRTGAPAGSPTYPFAAVLVMYDPECWHTDIQVTLDVLAGRGVAGGWRPGTTPPSSRPRPTVHFSNGDVLWANDHPAPRLGQGAFAAALRAVVAAAGHGDALAGGAQVVYGKPTPWPYRLADAVLAGQAARLARGEGAAAAGWRATGVRAVVAVGDNPVADVAGASAAGEPWIPLLVRTGVHAGPGNCPVHPAVDVVEDVGQAVEWGFRHGAARGWEG